MDGKASAEKWCCRAPLTLSSRLLRLSSPPTTGWRGLEEVAPVATSGEGPKRDSQLQSTMAMSHETDSLMVTGGETIR